jgi:hypothetical protein
LKYIIGRLSSIPIQYNPSPPGTKPRRETRFCCILLDSVSALFTVTLTSRFLSFVMYGYAVGGRAEKNAKLLEI